MVVIADILIDLFQLLSTVPLIKPTSSTHSLTVEVSAGLAWFKQFQMLCNASPEVESGRRLRKVCLLSRTQRCLSFGEEPHASFCRSKQKCTATLFKHPDT